MILCKLAVVNTKLAVLRDILHSIEKMYKNYYIMPRLFCFKALTLCRILSCCLSCDILTAQQGGFHLDTILLYHGSSFDFDDIDLEQCKPYKDFGQGFYTTAAIDHARSMAERNAELRESKQRRLGSANERISKWLYRYQFDAHKAAALAVKEFTAADREWGRFITLNRRGRRTPHNYDIVIGPTANDFTNPTIQFYMSGGVGEVGSDAAIDELVRLLLPYKLPSQYFFATKKAIDCLTLLGKEEF